MLIVTVVVMKRTTRLDRERQVALPDVGNDVFTTVGDLTRTQDEEEEFRANLVKASGRDVIGQHVVRVMQMQAAFVEAFINTLRACDLERVNFVFDGCNVAARIGEAVMATFKPNDIPKHIYHGVRKSIEDVRRQAREEDAAKAAAKN